MLSSEDIVLELRAKKEKLERVVREFEYITPEPRDIVEWCLYKTALHACELVASDHLFLFPHTYRLFMQYLAEHHYLIPSMLTAAVLLLLKPIIQTF